MNEAYFGICAAISGLLGVLIFSIGCAALNAELTAYIEANRDQLGVILFGGLVGLGLLLLSLPAIVYIAIVDVAILGGRDVWLWDNGGWGVFSYAWPLIGIVIFMWAIPLLRFLPQILATASTAVSPSEDARRAGKQNHKVGNAGGKAPPDPFVARTSNKARKEEAERTDLAAELDEAIADLERKKHELRQHRKHRN